MKRSAIKNETEQKLRPNQVFIQRRRDEETGITQCSATEQYAKNHGAESLNNTDKPQRKKPDTNSKCCMIPLMWKSMRGKIIHDAKKKKIRAEIASCGLMEKVRKGTSWVDGKVPSPVWGHSALMSTTESEKIQKNNYTYTYTERETGKEMRKDVGERETTNGQANVVKRY